MCLSENTMLRKQQRNLLSEIDIYTLIETLKLIAHNLQILSITYSINYAEKNRKQFFTEKQKTTRIEK